MPFGLIPKTDFGSIKMISSGILEFPVLRFRGKHTVPYAGVVHYQYPGFRAGLNDRLVRLVGVTATD